MSKASRCSFSICSKLIQHSIYLQSLPIAESAHAALIKLGFHRHIYLCNSLIAAYSNLGSVSSSQKLFYNLSEKNVYSWNILLSAFTKRGDMERARQLFDVMPERDIVSWNSIISGYASIGELDKAKRIFSQMQELGVGTTCYTLSIAASSVSSSQQARQIHAYAILNGYSGNFVLENALVDMYGRFRMGESAIEVFFSMKQHDIISWNELILALGRSGLMGQSLSVFELMLSVINMFSLCGRLECAVRFFMGLLEWDSTIFHAMASSYARSGLAEEAQELVIMGLREGFRPTKPTFTIMLNSISPSFSPHFLTQVHSTVLKSGFQGEPIVANSLLKLYADFGDIESSKKVFFFLEKKDRPSWNSMIAAFAEHGLGQEAIKTFWEMLGEGDNQPDEITLTGVLRACSLSGLVKEGALIFSSMEEDYGIEPESEHFVSMVGMLSRAGMVSEALEFVDMMGEDPLGCITLLETMDEVEGNLLIMEAIAQRAVSLHTRSSLPYRVLGRIHGQRGRWESMALVWRIMEERRVKKDIGYSLIAIRNRVFTFRSDQILLHGGESLHSMLSLLEFEMYTSEIIS
ncbi:tetratricopeptide repeat (TPR)-like superfamily protein [Wolffia australiana]